MISWSYLAGFLDGDGWITRTAGRFPHWTLGFTEQAFALLLTALGLGDKAVPLGLTREQFIEMATTVYDKSRKALATGVQAGG